MKTASNSARCLAFVLFSSFAFAVSSPVSSAELPAQWGSLTPGPYAVGFETVEKYDFSRVYRSKVDYDGDPRDGERARPVQICVWYPATASENATPMVYGEYVFPAPGDDRFFGFLSQLQGRELNYLIARTGNRFAAVADMMNLRVGAVKNAQRQEGSFPVVVYFADIMSGFSENSVLCEYLASHGFIVISTHSVGTLGLNASPVPADLETQIRDREFALAGVRDYPNSDPDRLAVIGCGWGGLEALVMQMRNSDVDAIITLDGAYLYKDNAERIGHNPYFDYAGVKVPLLQIYPLLPDVIDHSVIDSMPYSHRLNIGLSGFTHADLTHYPAMLSDSASDTSAAGPIEYATVCEYALDFLCAHVNDDATALTMLDKRASSYGDNLRVQQLYAQKPPPTELEFVDLIQQGKIDRAVDVYEQLKVARPGEVFFQEGTINVLGYQFLQANQLEDALKLFRINTEAFPKSANVWDSYADGCIANGDIETAIQCYKNVLEVLPGDSLLPPANREILLNNATQNLENLGK